MITFVHTADVHFGVENYGKIDPKTGLHSRLLDFVQVFSNIVDFAIEKKVDLFILAGDAYKTATPTPTQQKYLLKHLFRLQKAGIAVLIVVGNHDHPLSYGKAHALDVYSDLPLDGFYVFDRPKAVTVQTKNGPVQIVGVPWPCRQNLIAKYMTYASSIDITEKISRSVSQIVHDLAGQLDQNIPAILTGHLTVATGVFSGSEKKAVFGSDPVFMVSQLAIKPFNYVALGHLHRFQDLNAKGQIPVVYAGSPERIDFGEVRDTKGFVYGQLLEKDGSWGCEYSFEKLKPRNMIEINVTLNRDECFSQQIVQAIAKHDLSGAIVKVLYYLPAQAFDNVDLSRVTRALEPAFYVVGVFPVHKLADRVIRFDSTQLKIEDVIAKYLADKHREHPNLEKIIQTSQQLYAQFQAEQEDKTP